MDKESGMNKKRNELLRQTRRQNMNALFGQHRKTLKEQMTQFQEEQFNKIYPLIDQTNFQQHLPLILKYSYNDNYNYRLVAFSGYLYDFLLAHPTNLEALQTLESLSCFQELEIPQTEELANIIIQNMQNNKKIILQIVYNLLQASRYSDCLRDQLIDLNFLEKADYSLSLLKGQNSKQMKQYLQQLYVGILCLFISSQPLISYEIFQSLLKKTLKLCLINLDRQPMLLVALSDLFSSIKEDRKRAELVFSLCDEAITKQYYNCEQQIVNLFYYGAKCEIMISKPYYKLISSSLESKSSISKQKIVMMCDALLQFDSLRTEYLSMFLSNNFANRFVKVYWHCSQSSKQRILLVLNHLAEDIVLSDQQTNQEKNHLDLHELLAVLKNAVQSENKGLQYQSVSLILLLLQIIDHKQLKWCPIREKLEQQGVFELLTNLQMEGNSFSEQIECILRLSKIGQ